MEAEKERKNRDLEDLMERYALEAKKKNEERKAQNNNWIQREQHNATALSKEGKEKTKQENLLANMKSSIKKILLSYARLKTYCMKRCNLEVLMYN